jgi:hypothetical protein
MGHGTRSGNDSDEAMSHTSCLKNFGKGRLGETPIHVQLEHLRSPMVKEHSDWYKYDAIEAKKCNTLGDVPTSIDVEGDLFPTDPGNFHESPGYAGDTASPFQSSYGGETGLSPEDLYCSPRDDQMDVLGRRDLISSRFVPKTRPMDGVGSLGNDTDSRSAVSWQSRTSSIRSSFSMGSYRVQHPPMPLCSLQNLMALPILARKDRLSTSKHKKSRKHDKMSSKKKKKKKIVKIRGTAE